MTDKVGERDDRADVAIGAKYLEADRGIVDVEAADLPEKMTTGAEKQDRKARLAVRTAARNRSSAARKKNPIQDFDCAPNRRAVDFTPISASSSLS